MDRQAKRAIKSLVLELRKKLEGDLAVQLKRYGFARDRWLPLEQLSHVQQDDQAAIDHFRLKAALEQHLRRIGADPKKATPEQQSEAADWFVREVAFTHLNRLVALKCLEVRDLITEIITTRDDYGGRSKAHSDYRHSHPVEAGEPDDALPAAIRHTCRHVYTEFKFLFDVGDPVTGRAAPANTILWPSYPVLKECMSLINGLDQEADNEDGTLWSEDEIIGWIYQFYNAKEKEAIRKRGRPRRPAEVAVINQFFTPRWVVKFLVDNTLGRLWLEMHPDSERVRGKCDYLVPEPLGGDEDNVQGDGEGDFRLAPDSPINDPKAPARREPKRPQDVRLIDPACGTMHFGHYAFEVFQEIYSDARDYSWVTDEDALRDEEVPEAILRHNLYGVDIDLRAVQLAGLSLFIKAKTANAKAHISHVNLVVADAVLPVDGSRQRFLDQYKDDKVVQDAVRQVLDELANVAEVGSLLRVEERLRGMLAKAGHAAVEDWDQEQIQALPGFEPPTRQLSLAGLPSAAPNQWGAHYTLARLLGDLRAFATKALHTHDLNAQLFADEATKSVHLLDVCLNRYDLLLMNPPYGHTTQAAKSYIKELYPDMSWDIYSAFIARAFDLVCGGFVGALTNRTFMYSPRLEGLRRFIYSKGHLVGLAELGLDVLDDATVRVAASVFSSDPLRSNLPGVFFGLRDVHPQTKKDALVKNIDCARGGVSSRATYLANRRQFERLPGVRFSYWVSDSLAELFERFPGLEPTYAIVRQGAATGDDDRFLRRWWEVPAGGLGTQWRWYLKGGGFSRYHSDTGRVLDWSPTAVDVLATQGNRLPSRTFYFKPGIKFPNIGENFCARHMTPGCVIGAKEHGIYPNSEDLSWLLLGMLNSKLVEFMLNVFSVDRNYDTGHLKGLPIAEASPSTAKEVAVGTRVLNRLKATWDTGSETCTHFDAPWLVQAHRGSLLDEPVDLERPERPASQLTSLLEYVRELEEAADARLQALQDDIDEAVYAAYEISPGDRALIEREAGDRPPELVWPPMAGRSDKEKRPEHVRRLISYFLLEALKEDRDGIIPISSGTGQPTALEEIRHRIESEFGDEPAFRMESDIKEVLGDSIADWLDKHFFKWHIKLYKRRPIIWHLASPRNSFACFVYIHKLDRDTLRKVQTQYLWPGRRTAEGELEAAKAEKASRRIEQAESALDDLEEFEKRLLGVIRGEVECDIAEWAEGPFRAGVYDPVLDDGVKVNITPLQEAGVLRYKKVV